MSRVLRLLAPAAVLALTLLIPAAAQASTVQECQSAITDLGARTDASAFFGRNAAKEQAGLQGKLAGASQALSAGKLESSVTKLTDFRTHVVTIGQAGKLAAGDAADLASGADAAIACVQSIGA